MNSMPNNTASAPSAQAVDELQAFLTRYIYLFGSGNDALSTARAMKARIAELEAKLAEPPWRKVADALRYREALGYVEPILNEAMDLLSWAKHDLYKAGKAEYLDKIVCTQHEGEDALNRIRQLI